MSVDPHPVLIFANPISGRGQGLSIARRLEDALRGAGYAVRCTTKPPGELRAEDFDPDAPAAIVIGGDGTLRAVAERMLHENVRVPPLLPIPLGTANLMVRHLAMQWDESSLESHVVRTLANHSVQQLDVGRANGKPFLLMAGVGFDAKVVYELDRVRHGPIRFWDYLLPTALTVRGYDYPPLRVLMDGREIFPPAPALAFVGNLAEYGTGFPVLPHARPDDALLDVCVLPCQSAQELVQLFLLAAAGEHTRGEGVVYARGRNIRIESKRPVQVQVDGDPAGQTPVDLDLLPFRVPFIVPA